MSEGTHWMPNGVRRLRMRTEYSPLRAFRSNCSSDGNFSEKTVNPDIMQSDR